MCADPLLPSVAEEATSSAADYSRTSPSSVAETVQGDSNYVVPVSVPKGSTSANVTMAANGPTDIA